MVLKANAISDILPVGWTTWRVLQLQQTNKNKCRDIVVGLKHWLFKKATKIILSKHLNYIEKL